jgi:hypothetical protein
MPLDLPMPITADWLVAPVTRRAELIHRGSEIILDNGLLRLSFHQGQNLARVGIDQLTSHASLLRAIRPEAEITLDGHPQSVGGMVGQPIGNYLSQAWIKDLKADPASLKFTGFTQQPISERFAWKPKKNWLSTDTQWPPKGIQLNLNFEDAATKVTVHYELYDRLPVYSKWITVTNLSAKPVRLNSFKSEILAATEAESPVEVPGGWKLPNIQVESEFTTCAMTGADAARQNALWKEDPTYDTQVNYQLKTPCQLEVAPPLGPNRELKPSESFESFRTWFIAYDSEEATRKTLTLNRFYQAVTPWAFENPLIFHVRSADPKSVREAIDEAARVGFELVIMTFGSGFEIENDDPKYLPRSRNWSSMANRKASNWVAIRYWRADLSTLQTTLSIQKPANPGDSPRSKTVRASAASGVRSISASSTRSLRRPARAYSSTMAPTRVMPAPAPRTRVTKDTKTLGTDNGKSSEISTVGVVAKAFI